MVQEVELKSLNMRYQRYRIRSLEAEKLLLSSIADHGIRDPLQGIGDSAKPILLDGFKRYRCAQKLGIGMVQFESKGSDTASGILEFIRTSNRKNLSIIEQARLVDELQREYGMNVTDIAEYIEKSKAWVSVRAGIIAQMSETVLEKIFSGQFPVYSYMYTLRPFIRLNKISPKEVEEFVRCVSGKQLSIREIEVLFEGYFKGSEEIREHIRGGHISWGLNCLREGSSTSKEYSELERSMLHELDMTHKYMQRVSYKSKDSRYKSNSFYAQANFLTGSILVEMVEFGKAIKEFHDKSGHTHSDLLPS